LKHEESENQGIDQNEGEGENVQLLQSKYLQGDDYNDLNDDSDEQHNAWEKIIQEFQNEQNKAFNNEYNLKGYNESNDSLPDADPMSFQYDYDSLLDLPDKSAVDSGLLLDEILVKPHNDATLNHK